MGMAVFPKITPFTKTGDWPVDYRLPLSKLCGPPHCVPTTPLSSHGSYRALCVHPSVCP